MNSVVDSAVDLWARTRKITKKKSETMDLALPINDQESADQKDLSMSFGGKREDNGLSKKKMTTKDASNKDTRELVPCSYRFNDDFDEDEKKKKRDWQ